MPQERRPTGIRTGTLLCNICISDLLSTVSRKHAYADDLAIIHADGEEKAGSGTGAEQRHGNRG